MRPTNGLMEKRGGALIDIDRDGLETRMKAYYDKTLDWSAYKLLGSPLAEDAARFTAEKTRKKALAEEAYDKARLVKYLVRPFDLRFAYYTGVRPIWNEPRPQLWKHFSMGNQFLISRPAAVAKPEGVPIGFTRCLGDNDAFRGHAYYLPFLNHTGTVGMLAGTTAPNLSSNVLKYLEALGVKSLGTSAAANLVWFHALATVCSPRYLADNADGLAIDWPRIPLPASRKLLRNSADLGARVAAILDTEDDVSGVTSGSVMTPFSVLGSISGKNLALTAGWGRVDKEGRVGPGKGRVAVRSWNSEEQESLIAGFVAKTITPDRGFALLGRAVDIYLNAGNYWRSVPEATWEYYIGGYQVIKKWLSYREEPIWGRPLSKEEAGEVTAMVRRLTAIVLMTDELDANYIAIRDSAYTFDS